MAAKIIIVRHLANVGFMLGQRRPKVDIATVVIFQHDIQSDHVADCS